MDNPSDGESVLPDEASKWGMKLLEIIQGKFRSVCRQISSAERRGNLNAKKVKVIAHKMDDIEQHNKQLEVENSALREKLLDLEYHQRRNNLIFEGVYDQAEETESKCINKL